MRPTMAERLERLRKDRGGAVPLDDVASLLDELQKSIEDEARATMREEIADLLSFMRQARLEIAAIRPGALAGRDIPGATDELDAVLKATEQATFAILDVAETLSALSSSLDGTAAATVGDAVTRIYEASNFQDISGQRINKVIKALRHIEQRVAVLAALLGLEDVQEAPQDPLDEARALLSGPQLPAHAANQADIDNLFDSL